MDPSQKEAEPLQQVSPADLAVRLNRGPESDLDETIHRNRSRAGEELEAIWSLQQNPHFQWFWRECVEKEYQTARERYNAEDVSPESANTYRTQYLQMRRVMNFMLMREIEHRRLINPTDSHLPRLREKLRLL